MVLTVGVLEVIIIANGIFLFFRLVLTVGVLEEIWKRKAIDRAGLVLTVEVLEAYPLWIKRTLCLFVLTS